MKKKLPNKKEMIKILHKWYLDYLNSLSYKAIKIKFIIKIQNFMTDEENRRRIK
jgi:hypothetical protein